VQQRQAGQRAPTSNWKSTAEEDLAYRNEILASVLPAEGDEWMAHEMRVLTEFTRIFPPEKKAEKMFAEEFDGVAGEDDGDDGDDDDAALPLPLAAGPGGSGSASGNSNSSSSKDKEKPTTASAVAVAKPAATYEEILYQVFLQDKRQFQRMHNPLPRTIDGALPPLEANTARSSSSGASSQGNPKGVGWRAPPKQPEKKDQRQPTQTQLDAAKRLSQGLSVSQTSSTAAYERSIGGYMTAGGVGAAFGGRARYGSGMQAVVVLDQDSPQDGYAYAQLQAQSQLAQVPRLRRSLVCVPAPFPASPFIHTFLLLLCVVPFSRCVRGVTGLRGAGAGAGVRPAAARAGAAHASHANAATAAAAATAIRRRHLAAPRRTYARGKPLGADACGGGQGPVGRGAAAARRRAAPAGVRV